MYSPFRLAAKYLKYYFTASNSKGHGMHSPFVFEFITRILNDGTDYPVYDRVERLRQQLLNDQRQLDITDFGAGSSTDKTNKRKISSIAKNAAKPRKYGQLLYRIVRYYKPGSILELGTSLGITTSYLSQANPAATITTMEGSSSVLAEAIKNFESLGLDNIKTVEGNFDNSLPGTVSNFSTIDFAFLDGNHRAEPTIRYFNSILEKINNNSVIVLDDIHWSREMEEAWLVIKDHSSVKCSVDLFFIGILFFREEFYEQQHFTIRF